MVESQLISDPNPNMPKPLELEISILFFDKLKITKCKHCNTPFSRNVPIIHYQHSSGLIVPGYTKKQWLCVECPGCKFQWSLWKLGVSKDIEVKSIIPFEHQNDNPNYDPLIGSKTDLEMQVQHEQDKVLELEEKLKENPCKHDDLLSRDKSKLEKEFETLLIDKINLQSEIANLKLEKDNLQKEIQNLIKSD